MTNLAARCQLCSCICARQYAVLEDVIALCAGCYEKTVDAVCRASKPQPTRRRLVDLLYAWRHRRAS
jgi:hypothetical protein